MEEGDEGVAQVPLFTPFSAWWTASEQRTTYEGKLSDVGVNLDGGKGSLHCLQCHKPIVIDYNLRQGSRREGYNL